MVHGDWHPYPTAELTVFFDEQSYLMTVGVVANLSVAALLGWHLPVLMDLLLENKPVNTHSGKTGEDNVSVSCTVTTRAQAKAGIPLLPDSDSSQREGGTQELTKEDLCGQPLPDLDCLMVAPRVQESLNAALRSS